MKIIYETVRCGRCCGSGRYSYCAQHGDTCFGCSGKGKVLSRRGKAARENVAELREQLCGVPAGEVTAGMVVLLNKRWRQVSETTHETETYAAQNSVAVSLRAAAYTEVMAATTTIVRHATTDEWNALLARARNLPGASVVDSTEETKRPPAVRVQV